MKTIPVNILIVDDHSMVLEGMKSILIQIPDLKISGIAANAFDALKILREFPVDLVITDINLPDVSGIELCATIKKEFPSIHVIALSTFNQRSYISQMIHNGASGYLLKSADKEEIEEAIETVLNGKLYFSSDINSNKIEKIDEEEIPILTRREKEILQLIAEGLTNADIAAKLFVSPYTVDTHRKNLLAKFNISNTAALIKTAAAMGFF